MYSPHIVLRPNGVPILTKRAINNLAENYIRDFKPEALITPQAIDIDDFAFNYLGLKQDFHHLSHDESILGVMIFDDTELPVYNPEQHKAEYSLIDGGTIVIDNTLTETAQENRYRYTIGHEVGHAIFHKAYFKYEASRENSNQKSLHMLKRLEDTNNSCKSSVRWTDLDFIEWQANYYSAAVLMPKSMVLKLLRELSISNSDFRDEEYVYAVANTFKVSWEAAANRLNSLNLIINADRAKLRKNIFLDFVLEG